MTDARHLSLVRQLVRDTLAEGLAERRLPPHEQSPARAVQEARLLFARLGVSALQTTSPVVALSEPLASIEALLASLRVRRE